MQILQCLSKMNGELRLMRERELRFKLIEAESTVGKEDDVTPGPQDAYCIGEDNSDLMM